MKRIIEITDGVVTQIREVTNFIDTNRREIDKDKPDAMLEVFSFVAYLEQGQWLTGIAEQAEIYTVQ